MQKTHLRTEEIAKQIHAWHCPEEDWNKPRTWSGPKKKEYLDLASSIVTIERQGHGKAEYWLGQAEKAGWKSPEQVQNLLHFAAVIAKTEKDQLRETVLKEVVKRFDAIPGGDVSRPALDDFIDLVEELRKESESGHHSEIISKETKTNG